MHRTEAIKPRSQHTDQPRRRVIGWWPLKEATHALARSLARWQRVVYAAVIDRRPPRRLPRRLLHPRAWPCQAAAVRSQRPRRVAHAGRAQSVAHTQICRCRIQHVGTLCSPQGPRARWLHGTAGRLHSISAAQRRQPVDHPRPRSEEQPGLARLRRGARVHGGTGFGGPRGAAHGPASRARPRAPRRHLRTAPATRRTGPMPLWPQRDLCASHGSISRCDRHAACGAVLGGAMGSSGAARRRARWRVLAGPRPALLPWLAPHRLDLQCGGAVTRAVTRATGTTGRRRRRWWW